MEPHVNAVLPSGKTLRHSFPEQHEVLRELPHGATRQCRVAKRQDFETEVPLSCCQAARLWDWGFWDMMVVNCQNYSISTGLERRVEKRIWFRICWSSKDSQQIQTKPKTNCSARWDLWRVSNQQVRSLWRIEKEVLFVRESTNARTARLVHSCVPVSVELVDIDEDADENVDADQTSTERLGVDNQQTCYSARGNRHWLQSVWIATCSCETSRKLPCSLTREDRESSSSRSTSSRLAAE